MRFLIAIFVICLVQNYSFAVDERVQIGRLAPYDQIELAFDNKHGGWYITVPADTKPQTPQTEEERRFVNRTIQRMPTGICSKEVP